MATATRLGRKRRLTFSAETNRVHVPAERAIRIAEHLVSAAEYVEFVEGDEDYETDEDWVKWAAGVRAFAAELADVTMSCQLAHAPRRGFERAAPVRAFEGANQWTH